MINFHVLEIRSGEIIYIPTENMKAEVIITANCSLLSGLPKNSKPEKKTPKKIVVLISM